MKIEVISPSDNSWNSLIEFAEHCSWQGGKYLAEDMRKNFSDWERVVAAVEEGKIAGYCAVSKSDCINNATYTPYISYVFVDEKFRGNRLSQLLIEKAEDYLESQGFHEVFVVSHFEGFYEKYGYVHIDTKPAYWGEMQKSTDISFHRGCPFRTRGLFLCRAGILNIQGDLNF